MQRAMTYPTKEKKKKALQTLLFPTWDGGRRKTDGKLQECANATATFFPNGPTGVSPRPNNLRETLVFHLLNRYVF